MMETETVTLYGVSEQDLESQIHYFLDEPSIQYKSGEYYDDGDNEFAFAMVYAIEKHKA
jgi:hypothetical protein